MNELFDWSRDESGQSLMELLVSMPLVAVLLVSFGAVFAFGVRSYAFMMSDWELQKEIRFVVERMMFDLSYAEDVDLSFGKLYILCSASSEAAKWVEYALTDEASPRVTRDKQPMTGESLLGDIRIKKFEVKEMGERTVFFRLSGENTLTGHDFSLESAVTWPGREP